MTKNITICLMLIFLLGLSPATALAAKRATATYKLSVTLPPSVHMDSAKTILSHKAGPQQVTEEIVTAAEHRRVLLRTTVVK